MIRVYTATPLSLDASRVTLDPGERHHLDVRRAPSDVVVEVLDGLGGIGRGRVVAGSDGGTVELDEVRRVAEPPVVELLVGAGDRDRFVFLCEKAQELGATRIVPLLVERAKSVSTRVRAEHRDRLERRAVEAMKQCGNPWLVRIEEPVPLVAALASARLSRRWLADHGGADPELTGDGDEAGSVLVGPEGGLTVVERGLVIEAGFTPIRLGPHQLRFETAAIVALGFLTATRREHR